MDEFDLLLFALMSNIMMITIHIFFCYSLRYPSLIIENRENNLLR
jgi:hypothetical protein